MGRSGLCSVTGMATRLANLIVCGVPRLIRARLIVLLGWQVVLERGFVVHCRYGSVCIKRAWLLRSLLPERGEWRSREHASGKPTFYSHCVSSKSMKGRAQARDFGKNDGESRYAYLL